ncbi:MAG: 5'/3'-nucleotidase SurE [Spirochaetaceae bacterium]|nr:5'/3'-nucleotidase SurE [Spirochaetaceae bacterium]
MRILLTNDDGFDSEGLSILEDILCSYGHSVSVIAPSTQKSGASNCITLTPGVEITNFSKNHYHVSGTPADCILYGYRSGLFTLNNIDLVVSGINEGPNVSTDIIYSGTLGAARQAAILGFNAMAISCSPKNMDYKNGEFAYKDASIFLAEHIDEFYGFCSSNSLVNINVPNDSNGEWLPSSISFVDYHDEIVFINNDLESLMNNIGTSISVSLTVSQSQRPSVDKNHSKQITDFEVIENNKIAVSIIDVLPSVSSRHEDLIILSGGINE